MDIFDTREMISEARSRHENHIEHEKSLHFGLYDTGLYEAGNQIVILVNFSELIKHLKMVLAPLSGKKLRDSQLRVRNLTT